MESEETPVRRDASPKRHCPKRRHCVRRDTVRRDASPKRRQSEETPLPVFKVKSSYLKFSLASSDFYKFVYLCNRLFHVDTKQFAQYKVLNRWSIKAKLLFVWWLSRYLESTTAKVCGRSWEGVKNPEMCSVDIALYACCVHSRSLVSPSLMTDEVMTKDEDQHHL